MKQLKNESQNQDDNSDDDVTKEDLDQLKEDITRSLLANVSAQIEKNVLLSTDTVWAVKLKRYSTIRESWNNDGQ